MRPGRNIVRETGGRMCFRHGGRITAATKAVTLDYSTASFCRLTWNFVGRR